MRCKHFLALTFCAAAIGTMAGCGGAGALDNRDERDPVYRKAQERLRETDYDAAIELYNKALERKPGLAMAHLELGFIYDEHKEDYVRAIYHYQRYLEMRPTAEKATLVKDLIQHARLSFAASLPDRPNEAVQQIALLKREVETLQQQLTNKQAARAVSPPAPPAAPAQAAPPATAAVERDATLPPPKPAEPVLVKTYVVQAGDTLSRVATRVYGDASKWEVIYKANRGILTTPQSLKVGQTLTIPST